jgi:hypothetical protein
MEARIRRYVGVQRIAGCLVETGICMTESKDGTQRPEKEQTAREKLAKYGFKDMTEEELAEGIVGYVLLPEANVTVRISKPKSE